MRSECENVALSSELDKPRDPAVVDGNCGQRSAFRR